MNCPNCGFFVEAKANFCHNCGYRFDSIPQVEPIRIVVSQPELEEPTFVKPQTQPDKPPPRVIVEQPPKSNGWIIALTALTTLLAVGVAVLGYFLFFRPPARETVVVNVNANVADANAAKPSPTTYEDWKNKIAPPDKRTGLMDEEIEIAPGAHKAVPFSISDQRGGRIAGGLRVTRGKTIDFFVYPAEAYAEYPTNALKPVHLEQTRNKIFNERLKAGDYFLVFENNEDAPVSVAAEIFIVND